MNSISRIVVAVAVFAAQGCLAFTPRFYVTVTPDTIAFGRQVAATQSAAVRVTFSAYQSFTATPTAFGTVASYSLTPSPGFDVIDDTCTPPNPATMTCTADIVFTPLASGAATGNVQLLLSDAPFDLPSGAHVDLAGTGLESLAMHYYQSILHRAPDAQGLAFWNGEAGRMQALHVDPNEAWYAMAMAFFASPEYGAFGRDDAGFVTDLYMAFFQRAPDAGGSAYWTGQLAAGMPRGVALVSFMLSPEFQSFTQSLYGVPAPPGPDEVVMDFYRGLLSRLPDSAGFENWTAALRQARCDATTTNPGAAYSTIQDITHAFMGSAEYLARNRSDEEYVGDLYNAFLRRGGDLTGVQYWILQLRNGTSREALRQAFFTSLEFSARVSTALSPLCTP